MTYGLKVWDENGRELAQVPYETLLALAPLTDDPGATLSQLGIEDEGLKAALLKISEIAKSEPTFKI